MSRRTEGSRSESSLQRWTLGAAELRWSCSQDWLDFETTQSVEPRIGIENQTGPIEALRFGLQCLGLGQNVFVRGLRGGSCLTLVAEQVRRLGEKRCETADYGYVRNFSAPERPRLLTLPPGTGEAFKRRLRVLSAFITGGLSDTLQSSAVNQRIEEVREEEQAGVGEATSELKKSLEAAGLELVSVRENGQEKPAVLPIIDGNPVNLAELKELRARGALTEGRFQEITEAIAELEPQVHHAIRNVGQILRKGVSRKRRLSGGLARLILNESIRDLLEEFPGADVKKFLGEIIDDVVQERLNGTEVEAFDAASVYGVHLLRNHSNGEPFPVVVENHPTLANLVGSVDTPAGRDSEHLAIRAGAIARANGGCLILDAEDVRSEPHSWKVLVRTLTSGLLEILPPELSSSVAVPPLKPDPLPVDVKIILVGDGSTFRDLDQQDNSFSELFKVLADFDTTVERSREGARIYAGVVSRLAREGGLLPFERGAVAALIEQGARLADRPGRLTAHFTKIEDTAREAAFLASSAGGKSVRRSHVAQAVVRSRERADLPARRYRALLHRGTYNVETKGWVTGQVNGLAVMKAAQLTYGFPARLTASTGPGDQGIIDIESRASLSGNIHTKGMHILGGLLRQLLKADFPLEFNASLAFEQSYGSIDGDSASGAEICCLLSALADVPVSQGLAMTGSIDQRGRLQAVGGVNDKVEGFFDVCAEDGLTGGQGVIVPASNVEELMLREDVVEACEKGLFRVLAVGSIQEAIEALTGVECGVWRDEGGFDAESVLGRARSKARDYWIQAQGERD